GHVAGRSVHRRHHQRHDPARRGQLQPAHRARRPDSGRRACQPPTGDPSMKSWPSRMVLSIVLASVLCVAPAARGEEVPMAPKALVMYIHQHWSYNHPDAARTWTLEDWTGYLDGIHRLGYNTVLIWPVLETMPNPLTESDKANLEKIARVIDIAHRDYD